MPHGGLDTECCRAMALPCRMASRTLSPPRRWLPWKVREAALEGPGRSWKVREAALEGPGRSWKVMEGERGCPGRWWVPGRSWKVKEAALESPGGDGLPWTFEPRSMYMHAAPSPTRRPCPHPQRNPRAAWPEPSLSPQHLVSGGYAIRSRSDRPSLVQLRPP